MRIIVRHAQLFKAGLSDKLCHKAKKELLQELSLFNFLLFFKWHKR